MNIWLFFSKYHSMNFRVKFLSERLFICEVEEAKNLWWWLIGVLLLSFNWSSCCWQFIIIWRKLDSAISMELLWSFKVCLVCLFSWEMTSCTRYGILSNPRDETDKKSVNSRSKSEWIWRVHEVKLFLCYIIKSVCLKFLIFFKMLYRI